MFKNTSFWLKTTIVAIFLYAASQVTSIYLPVILAILLSFLLNPLVNFLCRFKIPAGKAKAGLPRGAAVLISFLFAGIALAIVATYILAPFMQEINSFVREFPELLKKIHLKFVFFNERFNNANIPDNVRTTVTQTLSETAMFAIGLTSQLLNNILRFTTRVLELIVVPVLTYYFLRDWRELRDNFISLFSLKQRPRAAEIIEEMGVVLGGYIQGQLLISVIIGLLVFSGLYILGVEYPLILGMLATLTETIPILGPIIGALPAIVLAYLASPILAVKVLLFYIIIHQIENHIVVPNVMSRTINLHPVIIILSLLVGGHLWGIAGMIIAVPVAALLWVLCKHLWQSGG